MVDMTKPTVFISHSSKDAVYLELLKRKLEARTAGVVHLFLSSDGQSIPFGTNWIHGIESALQAATIMFTAVSPASIGSAWLYFESGYAYSRGVRVIPIGINGAPIESLRPPLSLLQGFNIGSHAGLNNLIAVINQQYQLSFAEDFTETDYRELSSLTGMQRAALGSTLRFVDRIEFEFPDRLSGPKNEPDLQLIESPGETVREVLNSANIIASPIDTGTLHASGMLVKVTDKGKPGASRVVLKVDPIVLDKAVSVCSALAAALYNRRPSNFWFRAFLRREVRAFTTDYKISSRLAAFGIRISEKHGSLFEYENLLFAVDEHHLAPGDQPIFPTKISMPVSIRVVFPLDCDQPVRLDRVLELLERAGIIDDAAI